MQVTESAAATVLFALMVVNVFDVPFRWGSVLTFFLAVLFLNGTRDWVGARRERKSTQDS